MVQPLTPQRVREILRANGIDNPNDRVIEEMILAANNYLTMDENYLPTNAQEKLDTISSIHKGKTFNKYLNTLRAAIADPDLFDLIFNTQSYEDVLTIMKRLLLDIEYIDQKINEVRKIVKPSNRQQERKCRYLVGELTGIYVALTGEPPARPSSKGKGAPSGPFHRFCESFFLALEPDQDPKERIVKDTTIASTIDRVLRPITKKHPISLPTKEIIINNSKSGKKPPQK